MIDFATIGLHINHRECAIAELPQTLLTFPILTYINAKIKYRIIRGIKTNILDINHQFQRNLQFFCIIKEIVSVIICVK